MIKRCEAFIKKWGILKLTFLISVLGHGVCDWSQGFNLWPVMIWGSHWLGPCGSSPMTQLWLVMDFVIGHARSRSRFCDQSWRRGLIIETSFLGPFSERDQSWGLWSVINKKFCVFLFMICLGKTMTLSPWGGASYMCKYIFWSILHDRNHVTCMVLPFWMLEPISQS